MRVALRLHEALDAHRAGDADAREVIAAEIDEHDVLGAIFLRREQRLCIALAGRDRPGDRVQRGACALAFHDCLGRRADECDIVELEEEQVRRRVDASQGAIELSRRRRGGADRTLRDHDLEDVPFADVLFRALDAAQVLVALRKALEPPRAARAAWQIRLRPVQRR